MTVRNFPHFIYDGFLPYVGQTECTERLLTFAAISGVGAVLERKAYMKFGSSRCLYANSFIVLTGPSGAARKTTSANFMVDLLRELEDFNMAPDQFTPQKLILEMGDQKYQKPILLNGKEEKTTPFFIYSSEMRNLITENAKQLGLITMLTDLWDAKPYFVKGTANTGTQRIPQPALNLLACCSDTWLKDVIPWEEMQGGFASRIIFVPEFRMPEKLYAIPPEDPNYELNHARVMHDLNIIYGLSGKFKVTDEAKKFHDQWYRANRMADYHNNFLGVGYKERRNDHVLKLAMVSSACTRDDLTIDVDHIKEALHWLLPLDEEMHHIAFSGDNKLYNTTENVLKFIRKTGVTTLKEVLAKFNRNVDKRNLEICLQDLIVRDVIKIAPDGIITAS